MNVIVKIQGGLGNQMFQYAFGKEISLLSNRKLILDLSTLNERYDNVVPRDFDLTIFNVENYSVVTSFDEPYVKFTEIWSPESWSNEYYKNVKEQILKCEHENVYLDGYWPTPNLYTDVFDYKQEFSFKENVLENSKDILDKILNTNSVMINIRRKDFVDNNFHGCYGIDYVKKSIEYLKKNEHDLHFFVFSDDVNWCVNNLSFIENVFFVDHSHSGHKFGNYLQLMSLCKHFVIPNSTFAFWATLINNNPNKLVTRPKKWFKYKDLECNFMFENLNYTKIDSNFN